MKVKCDHRSKFSNLSNWKEEAWKKLRTSTGFKLVTSAISVRCSTRTELWCHTLGARWSYWVHIFPCSEMMRSLYEIIYVSTAVVHVSEEWSSQWIFQLKQLERRSLKKSGLQRDSNPWPPRYRCDALPNELCPEATHWEGGQFTEFISPLRSEMM